MAHLRRYKYEGVLCKVVDCDRQATVKGYCQKHYNCQRRLGVPVPPPRKPKRKPTCTIPGCDNLHVAKGYCDKHYQRWHTHGDANYINRSYNHAKLDRNKAIKVLYDAGFTQQTIGDVLGITRQRVERLVKKESDTNAK